MTDIITNIKNHLNTFRETHGLKLDYLSDKEVANIKQSTMAEVSGGAEYKRNWLKLAFNQKLNRLMIYHRLLADEFKLTDKQQEQLKILFYDLANSSILDEKDMINYNSKDGTIHGVTGLKQSQVGDFYLSTIGKKKTTVFSSVNQMIPISLHELTNADKHTDVIEPKTSSVIESKPHYTLHVDQIPTEPKTTTIKIKPLIKRK